MNSNMGWFLLPFFLYLGISLQALGIYLCGLLLPTFFLAKKNKRVFKTFLTPGLCLILIWTAFQLPNLVHAHLGALLPSHLLELSIPIASKYVYKNPVSTSILMVGIFLMALGVWGKQTKEEIQIKGDAQDSWDLYSPFLNGCFYASLLFSAYFVYQSITGFDYRFPNHTLLPEHKTKTGLYRIFGFYGHPLSMSGVSLAFFSFWVVVWKELWITPLREGKYSRFKIAVIVALNAVFLFLAGGRTALAVGGLVLVFQVIQWVWSSGLSQNLPRYVRAFVGLGVGFVLLLAVGFGVFYLANQRNIRWDLESFLATNDSNRFRFWRVYWQMFKDSPWWGMGYGNLEGGLRNWYYQNLGYAALNEKYNAHNLYLESLGSSGLLGTGLATLGFGGLIRFFYRWKVELKEVQPFWLKAFCVTLVANGIHSFTQNVYFDSNVSSVYLGFFCVLLFRFAEHSRLRLPSEHS